MKKVAMVANSTWYIYNFRRQMINKFRLAGFEVVVIAPEDEYSPKLNMLGIATANVYIDKKGKNPINDFRTIISFFNVYRYIKPDIILQYTIKPNVYGSLAAKFLKIPVINNIAGLGTLFVEKNVFTSIAVLLYKFTQKHAQLVLFQNDDDKELFLKHHIVSVSNIGRIPGSGVDLNRFSVSPKKVDKKFTFLFIARMIKEKGVELLIEAGKILNSKGLIFHIELLGFLDVENPNAISRQEMSDWEQLPFVSYLGISDSVEDIIAESDCVVLPSYYREGVPRTLLEAAAMGKPIITTNNVGCKDVVEDTKNGYLCVIKDIKSLADAMEKMLNLTDKEYEKMSLCSRAKMECEFDENFVIQKYMESIDEILSEKR